MNESLPDIDDVKQAAARIENLVHKTPIVSSTLLNQWLGHRIFFKAECLQKIGAFKARGALNTLMWLQETGNNPQHIVANSSGNHAQAVAWAAQQRKIQATIFMPADVSAVKAQATAAYGAEVILCTDRATADRRTEETAAKKGSYWIPPYNHAQVISGQGTATYEALQELEHIDAVFAPCGGVACCRDLCSPLARWLRTLKSSALNLLMRTTRPNLCAPEVSIHYRGRLTR